MSEFTRATKAVDEIEQLLSSGVSSDQVQRLAKLVVDTDPIIQRLLQKAAETDPAKKLFGPGMCQKVQALGVRWAPLDERAHALMRDRGVDPAALAASASASPAPRAASTTAVLTSVSVAATPAPQAPSADERRAAALQAAEARARQASGQAAAQPAQTASRANASTPAGESSPSASASAAAAAAEARARAAASGGWSCPACTYANAASRSTCEMCGTARPSAQKTESASATGSGSGAAAMQVDAGKALLPASSPPVLRMDELMQAVHYVFLAHGFSRDESLPAAVFDPAIPAPLRVRYVHEARPALSATYVPVQRHLIVYGGIEGAEGVPTRATVQLGMALASIQVKIDYLLVYPLVFQNSPPTLLGLPGDVYFGCLEGLAIPGLAALGRVSKHFARSVYEDDVLWWRVLLNLPRSPQLQTAIDSALQGQQQDQNLAAGICRRMVKDEVSRVRQEEDVRRRAREDMERRMRDPLMIQPPQRPGLPRPGFPGAPFGIGGPNDLFPGGGFLPPGGGNPFGGRGGRDPFGGGGGFFG